MIKEFAKATVIFLALLTPQSLANDECAIEAPTDIQLPGRVCLSGTCLDATDFLTINVSHNMAIRYQLILIENDCE